MVKRRYENINLNGERFTLDTNTIYNYTPSISDRDLDDCYGRAYDIKKSIYHDWLSWFVSNDGFCGIASHNCMMFTIEGIVKDSITGKTYYCYITKSNNRCCLVEA